jgi:hypothetical protein
VLNGNLWDYVEKIWGETEYARTSRADTSSCSRDSNRSAQQERTHTFSVSANKQSFTAIMTEDNSQYEPTAQDVLCGRGGATNNFEGNRRFRALVAQHQRDYLASKKKDKAAIAQKIVNIVQSRGGRFLQKNGTTGLWGPVTDKKAAEKTSQALREGLDVRNKAIKRARGDSESSSNEGHPSKRKAVTWSDYEQRLKQLYHSPFLTDSGEAPDLEEEVQKAMPPFIFHMSPVKRTDCNDVASV